MTSFKPVKPGLIWFRHKAGSIELRVEGTLALLVAGLVTIASIVQMTR